MGKRGRSGRRHRPAPSVEAESTPAVDADTVHYASGSDDGVSHPSAPTASTAHHHTDSESGEEDDAHEQIHIVGTALGESDVEVDLEFFDPTQADVTPLAIFLSKFTDAFSAPSKKGKIPAEKLVQLTASGLAEALCAQTRVGTVIRVADDTSPIGFISVLNLRTHQKLLSSVTKRLGQVCEAQKNADFAALLKHAVQDETEPSSRNVGLILCERVVNLPPQIIPKMLEALCCEIEWATEDEPSEEERKSFRFDYYLYITEVFERKGDDGGNDDVGVVKPGSTPPAKKPKVSTKEADQALGGFSFTRVEDEVWFSRAAQTVSWNIATQDEASDAVGRKLLAMIIPSGKIGEVRNAVSRHVGVPVDGAG